MKTSTLLSLLLTVSVVTNIWFWYNKKTGMTDCYVTAGFEAPVRVNPDRASGYAREYSTSLPPADKTLGGVITRSAFDELMCKENCNAIGYTFARDSSGDMGGDKTGVFVILTGLSVAVDPETQEIKEVKSLGEPYFITRHWCPPTCFAL